MEAVIPRVDESTVSGTVEDEQIFACNFFASSKESIVMALRQSAAPSCAGLKRAQEISSRKGICFRGTVQ